ncbi:MAG: M56 family metallopeptidase [Saprospiraceae bacterium]|nr:M56 family metallopeptidase [Lewinella sp.]
MNTLSTLPGEWIYALGWTVIHSLWQALIVALIVGGLLLRMQKQAAWKRYWVAHFGWFSILLCAIITFFYYYQPQGAETLGITSQVTSTEVVSDQGSYGMLGAYIQMFSDYFNRNLPLIVSLWALGMGIFLLRFLGGLLFLQHLKVHRIRPLPSGWQDRFAKLQRKLSVNSPVRLLESALVKVPMVIGWLKPVVLLPIGTINALSTEQVEAILAHELAHIKRHDYLLNLIRSLVEVLFYFNPAVWWLSAQIRVEREHCCDDLALEACGDSLSYVRALVALQELSQKPIGGLAMTFIGSKPELLNRVRRILKQPDDKSDTMEKFVITCLLFLCLSFTLLSARQPDEALSAASGDLPENSVLVAVQPEGDASGEEVLQLTVIQDAEKENNVSSPEADRQFISRDTVPGNHSYTFQGDWNGKEYNVKIINNKIKKLSINGKTIPEEEFANYFDEVQDLLDNNVPPAPPAPPVPPAAPVPAPAPTPPAPPANTAVPSPPSPPTPPSPAAPVAAPAPPAPPRIKLERPTSSEEGNNDYSYHIRLSDDGALQEVTANSSVWVSADTDADRSFVYRNSPKGDDVVVVVNVEDLDTETPENVVIELKDNVVIRDSDVPLNVTSDMALHEIKANDAVVFFGPGTKPNIQSDWKNRLENQMIEDAVLSANDSYHVELSDKALLINGKLQSEELHQKYLEMLQQSLDRPLNGSSNHFFFKTSGPRME